MQLKIIYSFENDLKRILDTIREIDWFKEKGYKVELPPEIDMTKIKEYSEQDVSFILKNKWSDVEYKKHEIKILEEWQKYSKRLENDLNTAGLKPAKEYIVFLTRYGVGGSYDLQGNNIVTLNVSYYERNTNRSVIVALLHEIVHINIEEYIKQNQISHGQKEKIVDMIMKKSFADDFPQEDFLQKWLYTKSLSEKSELIFNELYPDVRSIIKKLGILGSDTI